MRFRLVQYDTEDSDKYESQDRYKFFGDRKSIYRLWFLLKRSLKAKHVEVFYLKWNKTRTREGTCRDNRLQCLIIISR